MSAVSTRSRAGLLVPGAVSGLQTVSSTADIKEQDVLCEDAKHRGCSGNLINANELGKSGDNNKGIKRSMDGRTEEQIKG